MTSGDGGGGALWILPYLSYSYSLVFFDFLSEVWEWDGFFYIEIIILDIKNLEFYACLGLLEALL